MTSETAYNLICNLYATFGKSAPSRGSLIVNSIHERIAPVPDRAAKDICKKLQELDNLPSNLGKAIMGAWETWKLENPRSVYKNPCPVCGGCGGFEAYEKKKDGTYHHFFAFCPSCAQRKEGLRYLTPKEWKEYGVLCMPQGYRGGKVRFEYDNNITARPREETYSRSLKELKERIARPLCYSKDFALNHKEDM